LPRALICARLSFLHFLTPAKKAWLFFWLIGRHDAFQLTSRPNGYQHMAITAPRMLGVAWPAPLPLISGFIVLNSLADDGPFGAVSASGLLEGRAAISFQDIHVFFLFGACPRFGFTP